MLDSEKRGWNMWGPQGSFVFLWRWDTGTFRRPVNIVSFSAEKVWKLPQNQVTYIKVWRGRRGENTTPTKQLTLVQRVLASCGGGATSCFSHWSQQILRNTDSCVWPPAPLSHTLRLSNTRIRNQGHPEWIFQCSREKKETRSEHFPTWISFFLFECWGKERSCQSLTAPPTSLCSSISNSISSDKIHLKCYLLGFFPILQQGSFFSVSIGLCQYTWHCRYHILTGIRHRFLWLYLWFPFSPRRLLYSWFDS